MNPHFHFRDFVDTLDFLEVCRVTISPQGIFEIPSEKEGRIAQVSPKTRKALARFLREFSDRLECPDPRHVAPPPKRKRKSR